MKELIIELPIRVKKNKKDNKHIAINLNTYRNQHFQVETNTKKKYKEIIYSKLPNGAKFNVIEVETQFYLKTLNKDGSQSKTRKDKGNVYAIALKYFLDALVEKGLLEDDNDNFVKKETILPTIGVDNAEKEKVIFKIKEIGE